MRPIKTFHVRPALPARLEPLEELAYNLRWSWDHETIGLFRRLDRDLWERTEHNPVLLLGTIGQERLAEAAQDEAFLAQMDRVLAHLREYVAGTGSWYAKTFPPADSPQIAYFSMEFGITECLTIQSGGLGMLAGDHLKSASDLGLPLVGVGLLYQKGYFRQYLTAEGWQQERYPVNDFSVLPLRPLLDKQGAAVRVCVDLAGRPLWLQLWSVQVGRVTLVLLDSNLPDNPSDLRDVTDQLYGGDNETRIRQEIVLGVGGVRALAALGMRPRVFHMNEGHCAFLGLERIRELMTERAMAFGPALEIVAASGVFTTHTPVPAGIDMFGGDLIDRYLVPLYRELGSSRDALFDMGRVHAGRADEQFSMAVLAIRTAGYVNGVSRLHGEVSRAMWQEVWPGLPKEEVPIAHVTNGVHAQTWISEDMRSLYDRYLGPRWAEEAGETKVWSRAEQIPGEELWRTHERRRERLVAFARRRLADQLRARGAGSAEIAQAEEVLDPEALTIGFARRFATYKRGTLMFLDAARLEAIVNGQGRPVQILIAGKAHPRDEPGKNLIREVVKLARRPEFRRRIVFLEDYDMVVARYLVQGVDVWLNNPLRPMEASGTSGMKAAFNGALNLSIPDGWWDEAYSTRTGWAIGKGEDYDDKAYQDRVEAGSLYDLLEYEIVPLFYNRGRDNLPRGWIALMKTAMGDLCPVFNTNRMVLEYMNLGYAPAQARRMTLEADSCRRAIELARWKERIRQAWGGVRVTNVDLRLPDDARVGSVFEVTATVDAASLSAGDLTVEAYIGRLEESRDIAEPERVPMIAVGAPNGNVLTYRATIPCRVSGKRGLTVRVLPAHQDQVSAYDTKLIVWA